MARTNSTIFDNPKRFGLVSRLFHWIMALLIFWQLFGAVLHFLLPQGNALRDFFWNTHFVMGTLLFSLVIVRIVWALINLTRRPPLDNSFIGLAAKAGHLALYLLMLAIPLLALLRAYGSGRGFAPLGITIFSPSAEQHPDLMALGNNFHGELGWVLLILIGGHIGMVIIHRFVWKDGLDKRMF